MSFCAIHIRKQDVVLIRPVDSLVDVVNGESRRGVYFFIYDDPRLAAVQPDAADVGLLTAVDPEHESKAPYGKKRNFNEPEVNLL